MSRTTLTEARIRALKPRKTAYILRDIKLRGLRSPQEHPS